MEILENMPIKSAVDWKLVVGTFDRHAYKDFDYAQFGNDF